MLNIDCYFFQESRLVLLNSHFQVEIYFVGWWKFFLFVIVGVWWTQNIVLVVVVYIVF